jgi:hypothetical protein
MSVDPEENETRALFGIVNVVNEYILEIGSGDGRLTWHYAERVAPTSPSKRPRVELAGYTEYARRSAVG